jgi:hypothetical protein
MASQAQHGYKSQRQQRISAHHNLFTLQLTLEYPYLSNEKM